VPVVFVLDVSASMSATDVQPDRLTSARDAVARIRSLLLGGRAALVAVAEDAAIACPPTADTSAFLDILSQVRTNWMGAGGTRLSVGVEKARSLIAADGGRGVVVIVSDGEDHGDPVEPLLRQMRREGVTTDTLVVGSPEGATLDALPVAGASEPVVTKANPERMAAWAAVGGGPVWSVTPAGRSLPSRAEDVVPRAALKQAAREAGDAALLAPHFYVLAAILLLADLLLRP
jgi:Ca-activated chloride channel family protein